jgi:hypothetical protein
VAVFDRSHDAFNVSLGDAVDLQLASQRNDMIVDDPLIGDGGQRF